MFACRTRDERNRRETRSNKEKHYSRFASDDATAPEQKPSPNKKQTRRSEAGSDGGESDNNTDFPPEKGSTNAPLHCSQIQPGMYAFDPLATAPSGMTDACASQHQQHQQLSPTDPTPAVMATSAGLALTLAPPAGASGRHDGIGPVVSRNEHGVHGEGVGSTSTGHSYSGIFMDTPHQVSSPASTPYFGNIISPQPQTSLGLEGTDRNDNGAGGAAANAATHQRFDSPASGGGGGGSGLFTAAPSHRAGHGSSCSFDANDSTLVWQEIENKQQRLSRVLRYEHQSTPAPASGISGSTTCSTVGSNPWGSTGPHLHLQGVAMPFSDEVAKRVAAAAFLPRDSGADSPTLREAGRAGGHAGIAGAVAANSSAATVAMFPPASFMEPSRNQLQQKQLQQQQQAQALKQRQAQVVKQQQALQQAQAQTLQQPRPRRMSSFDLPVFDQVFSQQPVQAHNLGGGRGRTMPESSFGAPGGAILKNGAPQPPLARGHNSVGYGYSGRVVLGGHSVSVDATLAAKYGDNSNLFVRNLCAKRATRTRAPYRCGKCGQLKNNHLCPFKNESANIRTCGIQTVPPPPGTIEPPSSPPPSENSGYNTLRTRPYFETLVNHDPPTGPYNFGENGEAIRVGLMGEVGGGRVGEVRGMGPGRDPGGEHSSSPNGTVYAESASAQRYHYFPASSAGGGGGTRGGDARERGFLPSWSGGGTGANVSHGMAGWVPQMHRSPDTAGQTNGEWGSSSPPSLSGEGALRIEAGDEFTAISGGFHSYGGAPPPPSMPVENMTPSHDVFRWRQEMSATATQAPSAGGPAKPAPTVTLTPRLEALEDIVFGEGFSHPAGEGLGTSLDEAGSAVDISHALHAARAGASLVGGQGGSPRGVDKGFASSLDAMSVEPPCHGELSV